MTAGFIVRFVQAICWAILCKGHGHVFVAVHHCAYRGNCSSIAQPTFWYRWWSVWLLFLGRRWFFSFHLVERRLIGLRAIGSPKHQGKSTLRLQLNKILVQVTRWVIIWVSKEGTHFLRRCRKCRWCGPSKIQIDCQRVQSSSCPHCSSHSYMCQTSTGLPHDAFGHSPDFSVGFVHSRIEFLSRDEQIIK